MKKVLIWTTAVAVTGLLIFVIFWQKDLKDPNKEAHEEIEHNKEAQKDIEHKDETTPTDEVDYVIDKPEHSNLKQTVHNIHDSLQPNSEYKNVWADEKEADLNLLSSLYDYMNYYNEEIDHYGLSKDFEELEKAISSVYVDYDSNIDDLIQKLGEIKQKL